MDEIKQKTCCRCGLTHPETKDFFIISNRRGRTEFTSQCKSCRSLMWKEQYYKNRKYHIDRACKSTRLRRQREDVREKERIYAREVKRKKLVIPEEREKHRIQVREWFRNNREKVKALPSRSLDKLAYYTSLYNAAQLRATPRWADLKKISQFYHESQRLTKETGIPHEVDHIVPLRHKLASGLHVHDNLRVITMFENRSKSNRFISI